MCFAYAYRLQVLGMIQTDVVAVSDRNLAKTLQKGADGDKEPDPVTLEKFRAGDTVYRRGNNLYLGSKKERIQGDYPFYTGDGTGIWYFQATGSLITDDFMGGLKRVICYTGDNVRSRLLSEEYMKKWDRMFSCPILFGAVTAPCGCPGCRKRHPWPC